MKKLITIFCLFILLCAGCIPVCYSQNADTIAAEVEKANSHYKKGDYKKALELYQNILAQIEGKPSYRARTAQLYNYVALIYDKNSSGDKAIEYIQKSLSLLDKSEDNWKRSEYIYYNNAGLIYSHYYSTEELVEDSYLTALRGFERLYGKSNREYINVCCNLGMFYTNKCQYQKAVELFVQAILFDTEEGVIKPNHYSALKLSIMHITKLNDILEGSVNILSNESEIVAQSGLPRYKYYSRLAKCFAGNESSWSSSIMAKHSVTTERDKDDALWLYYLKAAYDSSVVEFGYLSAEAIQCQLDIIDYYIQRKDYAMAMIPTKEMVRNSISFYGEQSKEAALAYLKIGEIYTMGKWYDDAQNSFQVVLDISLQALGYYSDEALYAYINLAAIEERFDKVKAITSLLNALKIETELSKNTTHKSVNFYSHFSYLYEFFLVDLIYESAEAKKRGISSDDFKQQKKDQLYSAIDAVLTEEDPLKTLSNYTALGDLFACNAKKSKERTRAIRYYNKALNVCDSIYGPNSFESVDILIKMSRLYIKQDGKEEEAKAALSKAIEIQNNRSKKSDGNATAGRLSAKVIQDQLDTIDGYIQSKDYAMAIISTPEMLKNITSFYGKQSKEAALVYTKAGEIYKAAKWYDDALSSFQMALNISLNALGYYSEEALSAYIKLAAVEERFDNAKAITSLLNALKIETELSKNVAYKSVDFYWQFNYVYETFFVVSRNDFNKIEKMGITYDDFKTYKKNQLYSVIDEVMTEKKPLKTISNYIALGDFFSRNANSSKERSRAVRYYNKALTVCESLYGLNSYESLDIHIKIARDCAKQMSKKEEALNNAKKALSIIETYNVGNSVDLKNAKKLISDIENKMK